MSPEEIQKKAFEDFARYCDLIDPDASMPSEEITRRYADDCAAGKWPPRDLAKPDQQILAIKSPSEPVDNPVDKSVDNFVDKC